MCTPRILPSIEGCPMEVRVVWSFRRCAASLAVALFVAAVAACSSGRQAQFGHFVGDLETRWLDDGRKMQLLKPFSYVDAAQVEWAAPVDSIVDGASIPQFAWSLIGGPLEGKYRKASVIHDVACDERARPWESVHLAFYYAMLASGVDDDLAKVMYAAVYHFGPRWDLVIEHKDIAEAAAPVLERNLKTVIDRRTTARVSVRALPSRKVDLRMEVKAPLRTVPAADFSQLESDIRRKHLSLEQIRDFGG
jgi:hypothetical protein